ncbi:MAG TPA: ferritin-like domain-containing protein [Thermoanaerobaculia bacterium]
MGAVGGLKIGSEEHKALFCREFVATHIPFEPARIQWPELDAESLGRLKALPIWNEAVQTEAETALKVQTLGKSEPDPVLAEAIALQGYEEGRHAAVLRLLTTHYGIPVKPFDEPRPPERPVWAFLSTGYGECLDSFFAFGLFALGKRSRYFPMELIDVFDPIMQEEARHILFVVNWAAYLRARAGLAGRPAFDARRAWIVWQQLVGHARQALRTSRGDADTDSAGAGFTMNSHSVFGDVTARSFLELCLSENDRRLSLYDSRLLRPKMVPSAVRLALRFLPKNGAGAHEGDETPAEPLADRRDDAITP